MRQWSMLLRMLVRCGQDGRVSEYDARQLRRICERIDRYEAGEISLRGLIDDVGGLIACMETVPTTAIDDLRAASGVLDDWYAIALQESRHVTSFPRDPLIAEALRTLRSLVLDLLTEK